MSLLIMIIIYEYESTIVKEELIMQLNFSHIVAIILQHYLNLGGSLLGEKHFGCYNIDFLLAHNLILLIERTDNKSQNFIEAISFKVDPFIPSPIPLRGGLVLHASCLAVPFNLEI